MFVLLLAGLWAYGVNTAPSARAAADPPATVTGGLAVSLNPGSVSVGLLTISATVTYTCTCTVPGVAAGNAVLRVQFTQGANVTIGGAAVPCGDTEVNQTQTVTSGQLGMNGSQEITVSTTLVNGRAVVSSTANTRANAVTVLTDPTATFPGDGSVTLTGTYTCSSGVSTPGTLFATARQLNPGNEAVTGVATVPLTTCDGTSRPWSANITGTNSLTRAGDRFDIEGEIEADTSGNFIIGLSSPPATTTTSLDILDLLN
ncbi:DUF6299 family protein [Streptomyces laurentii]|uniref:DUF6299 family protein n=1 Tax=Streptomyces laurentii TaxID=39478 RepID=UPI0036B79FFA